MIVYWLLLIMISISSDISFTVSYLVNPSHSENRDRHEVLKMFPLLDRLAVLALISLFCWLDFVFSNRITKFSEWEEFS
jgi:hypothetical protein